MIDLAQIKILQEPKSIMKEEELKNTNDEEKRRSIKSFCIVFVLSMTSNFQRRNIVRSELKKHKYLTNNSAGPILQSSY